MKAAKYYARVLFIDIPRLSHVLSKKSIFHIIMLNIKLWSFLISRKTFLKDKAKRFLFNYKNKSFVLNLKSGIDVAVLIEVFVLYEYKWDLPYQPKNVLDLGAHWGDTAIYYALEYPQAKIFSVEPSSEIFSRLQHETKQFKNIVPVSGALGDSVGTIEFFVSKNSLGNSLKKRSESDKSIFVQTYDIKALCNLAMINSFDLVKFDIEGGEKYLFSDQSIKSLAKAFIGEIHLDLMDVTLDEIKEYFSGFDTTFQKINHCRYIVKAIKR